MCTYVYIYCTKRLTMTTSNQSFWYKLDFKNQENITALRVEPTELSLNDLPGEPVLLQFVTGDLLVVKRIGSKRIDGKYQFEVCLGEKKDLLVSINTVKAAFLITGATKKNLA